jgi:hypothetical protein
MVSMSEMSPQNGFGSEEGEIISSKNPMMVNSDLPKSVIEHSMSSA